MSAVAVNSQHLYIAQPQVARRLQQQALKAYAKRNSVAFLNLEEDYSRARELLSRIIAQAARNDPANAMVADIIDLARMVISTPTASKAFPFEEVVKIGALTNMTEQLWARARLKSLPRITAGQVQLFIDIADLMRETYLAEGYDPTEVINAESYSAAHLIARNSHIYDAVAI